MARVFASIQNRGARGATTRANAGVQHNQAKGGTDQGNGRNLKEEGKEDLRVQVQD